ncbi:MAG: oligopeptide:H+ symporter [Gammaproteobacteria bacterium]|nr:oligopeptide:H+ symporter [Gammaproteobacteria bacterium]NNF62270.1 MFS transporter [Gammaproteobacteria bacterium]NNM21067.1 MFS transporter [Gammaproteobacteria bacterium]
MQDTVTTAGGGVIPHGENELFGHPKGLYVCFATELWERFSFYGMKYLLLLYLTKYHLFSDADGLNVLGSYAGLVYALPVIGGLLADRYLGFRKAVVLGGIMLSLGHVLMAVEGHQAVNYVAGTVLSADLALADGSILAAGTVLAEDIVKRDLAALNVFYMALALIVIGVGFLKPNISTIVGRLYEKNDPRRDAGFTIFYMGINIGSFVATLLCGWLGETYGWKYGFGAAGIGMIVGLFTFLYGQKYLYGHAEPAEPARLKESALGPINKEWAIYIGAVLSLAVVWFLVQSVHVVHAAQNSLLIVAIVGLILHAMMHQLGDFADNKATMLAGATVLLGLTWALLGGFEQTLFFANTDAWLGLMLLGLVAFVTYGFVAHKSVEYSQTVVLMVLIVSTIVFWALFEQSAASMTLYADRVVDREVGGFTITAAQFGSLNAGFIMLLAIPFATLWVWLAKHNMEPSTPVKFSLGIIQVGLGFGALVLGAGFPDQAGKVAAIWLVLAYLLHTTGELCLSPVGLSAVTKLSIGSVVGVSMGTWFLATALSETLATQVAKAAALDTSGTGGQATDVASALASYTELFTFLMWLGIGVGIFMLVISPLLRKGMHDVH